MNLCNIKVVKDLMARYGTDTKKGFGQNFLINPMVPENIADESYGYHRERNFGKESAVLEIGPGIGALTCQLCERYDKVVAVEIDRTLIPILAETLDTVHPNTMDLIAIRGGEVIAKQRFYSVGGGSIIAEGETLAKSEMIYPLDTFKDIADYCREKGIRIWEYAFEIEGEGFYAHMQKIWNAMKDSIKAGIEDDGILPGGLGVHKKAKQLYNSYKENENRETREDRLVCALAFAVGEQNAAGEKIVTAPTCGAAGVLPAVMLYHKHKKGATDDDIIKALTTAGVVGNLIKHNASISGAECGCQAEVGSACSMAAAALAELYGMDIDKIEYAAEIALEHHLGLTCDPICGLVQIPCIERNAVAAMRAINAANLADLLFDTRKISFDKVVIAMKETGDDMSPAYKETSEAGLAKIAIE